MTLARTEILLDSQKYPLVRQNLMSQSLSPSARRWSAKKVAKTTTILPRENVRQGAIEDEFIISYNDWSKGVVAETNPTNEENGIWVADGVAAYFPGRIVSMPSVSTITLANNQNNYPIIPIIFNSHLYIFNGIYMYKDGSGTAAKTFDAGDYVTDAIVWNNELVVGFGSVQAIEKMATGETWTAAGTAYATYFATVEDRLWRATNTNEVSNIGPTDDPQGTWSASITIGDDDVPITDLNGYGERLAVSKENGLFVGDNNALFPNVLPQLSDSRDPDNGKNTRVMGSSIFFPCHREQILEYASGVVRDVGLGTTGMTGGVGSDSTPYGLSNKVNALAVHGQQLYLTTPPPRRMYDVTGALKSVNLTAETPTYDDCMMLTTDNSSSTVLDISSLDTLANGDGFFLSSYIPAGYTYEDSFDFKIVAGNSSPSVLSAHFWNGSTWVAMNIVDGTSVGGCTMAKSGAVYLPGTRTSWATINLGGTTKKWIRFTVSAALDAATTIGEIRSSFFGDGYVFRGTRNSAGKMVWTPVYGISEVVPASGSIVVGPTIWPYATGGAVIVGAGTTVTAIVLPTDQANEWEQSWVAGEAIFWRDNAGMPGVEKQWLDVTIYGNNIGDDNTVDLFYRATSQLSFNTGQLAINTSPTTVSLTSVSARYLQLKLELNAAATDLPTEVNCVEVRFRAKATQKSEYTMLLEVYDARVPAATQLTALRALVGGGTKTLIDPLGQSKTVTVSAVEEEEYIQEGVDYPVMVVKVVCCEA